MCIQTVKVNTGLYEQSHILGMVWGLHPYTRHNPQKLDDCTDRHEPVWCPLVQITPAVWGSN